MAKPIIVSLRGVETTFSFVKLDRSKLYGRKRRPLFLEKGFNYKGMTRWDQC